jgi:hypothetical protein
MKNFEIWKTITINKKPSTKGINISSYASDMLKKVKWNKKQTLDLVKVTVQDLFNDENIHTTDEIFAKAKEQGLDLCPPQVGLQLRVEYKDQPMNEWLYMGMKPITDSDGNPDVFRLGRLTDGTWLGSDWAEPDGQWDPKHEFVFSLRKFDSLELKPLESLDPLTLAASESNKLQFIEFTMLKYANNEVGLIEGAEEILEYFK